MIHTFDYCKEKTNDVGVVISVNGPIAHVSGLTHAKVGEGVTFQTEKHGQILTITETVVEILLFSRDPISPGVTVARSGQQVVLSVGDGLLGHCITPLGYVLDDRREKSSSTEDRDIELRPSDLSTRVKITETLETGVSIVDLVVPMGRGQRELIIGDRKTGKTALLLQTMVNQAKAGVICIYALIGKQKSETATIYAYLKKHDVEKNCIIVVASANDSPGEIYAAPFSAMTIAEYFRDQGKHTLVILDDLTSHAKYWREISLLGGRFPGRESYPGDIFYLHARLLERAGCFHINGTPISISCLPVAEAPLGDITGYIQTNLMSMTDGHIFFDTELFQKGIRPAVNTFLSVTRVGRQTQTPLLRDIGKQLMQLLKKYRDMQRFLRFGPEMTEQVQDVLRRGDWILILFQQLADDIIPANLSALFIGMVWAGVWHPVEEEFRAFLHAYKTQPGFALHVDRMIEHARTLDDLCKQIIAEEKQLFHAAEPSVFKTLKTI